MKKHNINSKIPIVEILCIFGMDSTKSITKTELKIFKQNIKNIFPNYSKIPNNDLQTDNIKTKYIFENKEKNMSIILHDLIIEFHIMNNYLSISIENIYDTLIKIYETYSSIIPVNKINFCQIGWLNKIIIPNKTITLSDYFTFTPNSQKKVCDFIIGYKIEDEKKYRTSLSLSPTKSDSNNEVSFILDIRGNTPINGNSTDDFIDILHNICDNMMKEFNSAITDNTKKLFREIK